MDFRLAGTCPELRISSAEVKAIPWLIGSGSSLRQLGSIHQGRRQIFPWRRSVATRMSGPWSEPIWPSRRQGRWLRHLFGACGR
jgi:hypothetical protein